MAINSAISICNLALAHLGIPSITNIEVPITQSEIVCAQYYEIARQTLYRDCFFQFSMKQIILPEDSDTSSFLYKNHSTQLPLDFISLIYLYNNGSILTNNGKYYRLLDNRIQSNVIKAPYNILYIKDVIDVSRMSPEFKLLLSYYLAFLMADSLGASGEKIQKVSQLYQQNLVKAKSNNGIDNVPIRVNNSNYIDSYAFVNATTLDNFYF
jgi:hypothetical protein